MKKETNTDLVYPVKPIKQEQHTKGEWKQDPNDWHHIVNERGETITQVYEHYMTKMEAHEPRANAQRIVKAVNMHDELVNQLKEWERTFQAFLLTKLGDKNYESLNIFFITRRTESEKLIKQSEQK